MGDEDAIRRLVAAGADLEQVFDIKLDPGGRPNRATPLMVAAGSGDGATVDTVRLLLSLGADPQREVDGQNAVAFACRGLGWNYRPGGDVSRLKLLLEAGCPLPADCGIVARMVADLAATGDAARLAEILKRGAPVDPAWDEAIAKEAAERHLEFARRMRSTVEETTESIYQSLAKDVIAELKASAIKLQEQEWARMATAPNPLEIPLFQAAASGSAECVRLLLDAGAKLDVRDASSETALWHATTEEVIRLLVERGLSLEDVNRFEWSPLVSCLADQARVRAFIAAGADVNATHDRGYTVFMNAVGSNRDPEVLRTLIAAGADPHATSDLGYNAWHAAIDVSGEANSEESVCATFSYLKELGVDLEHRTNAGLTPLARAILEGTAMEVRILCEMGADVNATAPQWRCGTADNGDGWDAASNEDAEITIDAEDEADVDAAAACERSDAPLIFTAITMSAPEKLAALVEAGANLFVTNADGESPLEAAESQLEVVLQFEPGPLKDRTVAEARRCVELLRASR